MPAIDRLLPGLVLLMLLAGCASPAPQSKMATLTGTVTYRQKIAMPSGAEIDAKLVRLPGPGYGERVIAENRFAVPGQVPISFSLTYDPRLLEPGCQYAVQARILNRGKAWMIPMTVNHLMEGGRITHAEIILQPAAP